METSHRHGVPYGVGFIFTWVLGEGSHRCVCEKSLKWSSELIFDFNFCFFNNGKPTHGYC